MSGSVSYLAWRVARNFTTTWHLCVDAKYTLCGRQPDGLLSVWRGKKPPPVENTCRVCRTREAQELRNR